MEPSNEEFIKRKNDFMNRLLNQKLLVKEENLYSIIARTEREEERNRPFRRYTKRKDNHGEFVIANFRQKVYRDNWRTIQ